MPHGRRWRRWSTRRCSSPPPKRWSATSGSGWTDASAKGAEAREGAAAPTPQRAASNRRRARRIRRLRGRPGSAGGSAGPALLQQHPVADDPPLELAEVIDKHLAIEVVDLVLEHVREAALGLLLVPGAGAILVADLHLLEALHLLVLLGDREAA